MGVIASTSVAPQLLPPRKMFACAMGSVVPAVLLGFYVGLRAVDVEPPTDAVLADDVTSAFFMLGAGVCHLMTLLGSFHPRSAADLRGCWHWLASALFLILLAADEMFMIHETLSAVLGVDDAVIFGVYGAVLLLLLALKRAAWQGIAGVFFVGFVAFSGAAVAWDYVTLEGMVPFLGRERSLEQLLEAVAAMMLALQFAAVALGEISARGSELESAAAH